MSPIETSFEMEENTVNKKYPFDGNKWYKKNKYGTLEDLGDQCENETCNCIKTHCLFEQYLWEEHYMFQGYKKNMLDGKQKKDEEGET